MPPAATRIAFGSTSLAAPPAGGRGEAVLSTPFPLAGGVRGGHLDFQVNQKSRLTVAPNVRGVPMWP